MASLIVALAALACPAIAVFCVTACSSGVVNPDRQAGAAEFLMVLFFLAIACGVMLTPLGLILSLIALCIPRERTRQAGAGFVITALLLCLYVVIWLGAARSQPRATSQGWWSPAPSPPAPPPAQPPQAPPDPVNVVK